MAECSLGEICDRSRSLALIGVGVQVCGCGTWVSDRGFANMDHGLGENLLSWGDGPWTCYHMAGLPAVDPVVSCLVEAHVCVVDRLAPADL